MNWLEIADACEKAATVEPDMGCWSNQRFAVLAFLWHNKRAAGCWKHHAALTTIDRRRVKNG